MTRIIIGSLVGAIITFFMGFMSWTVMGTMEKAFHYNENQDAIIQVLSEHLKKSEVLYVPTSPPGTSQEQMQAEWDARIGKPWAVVHYNTALENAMGPNMAKNFMVNLIAALMICLALSHSNVSSFIGRFGISIAFVIFMIAQGIYVGKIWFDTPGHNTTALVIDALMTWGLASLWFAWWMGRGKSAAPTA
jgi:hypothetical protein